MRRALLFVMLSATCFIGSRDARADETTSVAAQAETLRRANDRFDAGDYAGAIALYENIVRALGERRAMKVLFNLALAYEAVGDVTSAVASYNAFLDACRAEPFPTAELEERRRKADARREELMKTNGAIHVVASRSSPAFFRLGDGAVRPAGGTVWVVPGDHVVELDTGTPEQHAVHVLVEPGKVAELRIDAAPAAKPLPAPQSSPPAPAPAPAPPTSERRFPTVPVIVGVSATLVAGVLPVVFGLGAASKRSAAQDAGTTSADYPSLRQDYMDARTRYYVSFSLPAVIAIGSAVWIILSASSSSPSR